jgi:hypothetical protein
MVGRGAAALLSKNESEVALIARLDLFGNGIETAEP